jgi:hypothetical protein
VSEAISGESVGTQVFQGSLAFVSRLCVSRACPGSGLKALHADRLLSLQIVSSGF